ncbi:MAG: uridylate kinase [Hyphomicrobiales bacterium]
MKDLTVVKLGGSHALSGALPGWLASIEAGAGKAILVVGGGPFADAVRAAQPLMRFDDRAADAMALLAMEQYAIAISALGRLFTVAESRTAILEAIGLGRVPIWAPSRMVRRARDRAAPIAASWDVTSDSLSAWLAGSLGARRLFLIKRAEVQGDEIAAAKLAKTGIVDAAFPRFLAASGAEGFLIGQAEQAELARALRRGAPIGKPIGLVAADAAIHHAG